MIMLENDNARESLNCWLQWNCLFLEVQSKPTDEQVEQYPAERHNEPHVNWLVT